MSTHKEIMDDFYGEIITRSKIVGQPFKILTDEDDPEEPNDDLRLPFLSRLVSMMKPKARRNG